MFAEIILKNSLFENFTYRIPDALVPVVKEGFAVIVPLKSGIQTGFIRRITGENLSGLPDEKLKSVIDIFPLNPVFSPNLFRLLLWASEYYIEPPGNMLFSAIPSGLLNLSHYKLIFRNENNVFGRKSISLSSGKSISKKLGVSLTDIFNLINRGEVYPEVALAGESSGNYVLFSEGGFKSLSDEELGKITERYPSVNILLRELKE
ncbi:MAG: hypothetical protein N3B13_05345, partial [Deltaproteobacteria bacterium]|nr:hypothetical protein [Deltaproteobacteria bacterium]